MMPTITGTRGYYPYPAGHTRAELRTEIARYFGLHELTATGGSTTTVIDSTLTRFANDYFTGAQVWIEQADGAAPQHESAWCNDFAASTGTLTVAPAFSAAVQAGDKVQVYLRCSQDAIDNALAKVAYGAPALYSLTPSTTTVDYSLNNIAGLHSAAQIVAVWLRPQNDTAAQPGRITGYQLADDDGILTLRLPGTLRATDGLWLEFVTGEDYLVTDDARINLPVALIRARAICYLIESTVLPQQDNAGLQHWGTLLRDMRDVLNREERQRNQRPGKVQGLPWGRVTVRDGAAALGLTEHYGGDFGNYP